VTKLRTQAAQHTLAELSRLLRRSKSSVEQKLRELGLRALDSRSPQYYARCLVQLLRHGELRITEVSLLLKWNLTSARERLKLLMATGYVERTWRQGWYYRLTPAGRAWYEEKE